MCIPTQISDTLHPPPKHYLFFKYSICGHTEQKQPALEQGEQNRTKAKNLPLKCLNKIIAAALSLNKYYVLFLLQEGFDALDPFIPILVSNYNPKEFESCIQYYLENNWLQHEKGQLLNFFLSQKNPTKSEPLSPLPSAAACNLYFIFFPFILTSFWLTRWVQKAWGWGGVVKSLMYHRH